MEKDQLGRKQKNEKYRLEAMIVLVVVAFHDLQAAEISNLGDAFWLADTRINRTIAEAAWATAKISPNSAIFDWNSDNVNDDDIIERLDDVDLHHPQWDKIRFLAVPLTLGLQAQFQARGLAVECHPNGFTVKR